jgi:hypothetical protein
MSYLTKAAGKQPLYIHVSCVKPSVNVETPLACVFDIALPERKKVP